MVAFTDAAWGSLVDNLVSILGPGAQSYSGKRVARLVAAVPYLAGSEDPDRFALANLLTLHAATIARKVFDHRVSDDADLHRRLASFKCGSKSDEGKLRYGLNLLALIMISDYVKDAADDEAAGKYNPFNSGAWDAESAKSGILADLEADYESASLFDPFMTTEEAVDSFWYD